jgi:spermidine synthase
MTNNPFGSSLLRAILALIGFTAVIAQIVLMRELIVVFYGNEISLGLMLASWLLWTAIGSSILGRLTSRVQKPRRHMAGLQVLSAVALPLSILAVRASKSAFQPIPGELLGPWPMLLTSLVALSLFCVVSGWLFAAGSRLYAEAAGTTAVVGTGSVYLLEALGSGVGGLLASLVLIRHLSAFEIASLLSLLNLLAAAALGVARASYRRAIIGALVAIFVFLVFPFGSRGAEAASLAYLWRGFRLVAARNSAYGNLAVLEAGGSRSLFENGLVMFHVPDPAAAEEAVHFALLQHPSPTRLLLIGGGVSGSLAQALRHPSLEQVDYVELDPTILDLAQQYFPSEWTPIRADPRVRLHHADGRLFLKTTESKFDVVIVNLPEPQTAQLNRFYTLEFFREAAQKLTPGGILSFQLRAAENYISPELGEFLRCIHKTLREVFPQVTTIPGETVHFFAAKGMGTLAADAPALLSRLRSRRLRTRYVSEYYIPFRMSPDRMLDLERQIRPQENTPVNRDFAPIAYYFDVALWSTRFNQSYRQFFQLMASVDFRRLAVVVGLLLFAVAGLANWFTGKEHRPRTNAACCVTAMGFTLIGLEILLLLAFQAIYGYVYHQLAIVIASFMVGMALGSWRGLRRAPSKAQAAGLAEMQTLTLLQALAALSPLLLYVVFVVVAQIKNPSALSLVSQTLFPTLALLCGLLGGYQFPVASRIYFSGSENGMRSPGIVYALDLAGACVGAVVLSAYWVPVFGFLRTALLMAVVNLAPAVLAGLAATGKVAVRP